jgi:tetratricopeptide (TPR) repeat protein
MANKITVTGIVLFLMVAIPGFYSHAQAQSDAASLLAQANALMESKDYQQAEPLYRSIVVDWPGTDEAFTAQKSLAIIYIATVKYAAAQTEVDALIAGFANHPQLPAALYEIANQYWSRYRYTKAGQIYKYIADNRPESSKAMSGRTWSAGCEFMLGKYEAAWEEIDKLTRDFAGHPDLAQRIYDLAASCWFAHRHDQARKLYKYIAENLSQSSLYFRGRVWVVGSDIRLGNYEAAKEGFDTLLKDFAEHSELTGVIYQLGNEYWYVRRYEDAKQLYGQVLEREPNHMRARAWTIGAELMAGAYDTAWPRIEALVADFAGDEHLPWTLNELGRQCELSEQDPLVKYAQAKRLYQMVIERYPNSGEAAKAKLHTARADVFALADTGNDDAALAGLDEVLLHLDELPDLAETITELGLRYYTKARLKADAGYQEEAQGYYRKAIAVWEKLLNRLSASDAHNTTRAYHGLSLAYAELGEYEKATTYYNRIVAIWPDGAEYPDRQFIAADRYCGAYVVWHTLQHYRRAVPITNVISEMGLESKSLASIYDIVHLLKSKGISARAVKIPLDKTITTANPFIQYIAPAEGSAAGHFVLCIPDGPGKAVVLDGIKEPKLIDLSVYTSDNYNVTRWDGTAVLIEGFTADPAEQPMTAGLLLRLADCWLESDQACLDRLSIYWELPLGDQLVLLGGTCDWDCEAQGLNCNTNPICYSEENCPGGTIVCADTVQEERCVVTPSGLLPCTYDPAHYCSPKRELTGQCGTPGQRCGVSALTFGDCTGWIRQCHNY